MERKILTKQDIDRVRDIEGFPVGADEDIIALSDAPYYTSCPNPFVGDFIKEKGKYTAEIFAVDFYDNQSEKVFLDFTYNMI